MMQIAVEAMIQAMVFVVQGVPIGTNVGLVQMLWVMGNGSFLSSRGAVFGALAGNGLPAPEMRRSWAALRHGRWDVNELLGRWQVYVASENQWRPRLYAGYRVLSVDIPGFWRPKLTGWLGKHFHPLAQKALPAVVLGVLVVSGQVKSRRIPLLGRLVRCPLTASKADFRHQLLCEAAAQAAPDQVVVVDAEFGVAEMQAAGVPRFVLRLASNATARRNQVPAYKGIGKYPEFGEKVRPLARQWKERQIPATAPDQTAQFDYQGRRIQVAYWQELVTADTKVDPQAPTYSIYVYFDPFHKHPLLLATNLTLAPHFAYLIYRDRWPVEQPPLAAKQMIGLHRHFVFAAETCFRLPELALLAGAILTYVAAVLPPVPTGFWDRTPQSTPGRLRRLLAQADLPNWAAVDPHLRQKRSVTAHLPKGIEAHRRQKLAA